MKLQLKLSLGFAGILAVVAFAGCTGRNPATPTTSPSPTASAAVRTSAQQVIIRNVVFSTNTHHYMYIKNLGNAPANLSTFWLSFHPTTNSQEATSSILVATDSMTPATYGNLAPGAVIKVALDNTLTATPDAMVSFNAGTVQYTAGGALALFTSQGAAATNMSDFTQWGVIGTLREALASQANLWKVGTTVATQSFGTSATMSMHVVTEGATGSTNWSY